ncbi:hypothetical protein Q5691_06550 [Microcoleus sp. w1-18aA5]
MGVSLKNLVSDRCGLWNAFSFLTFRETKASKFIDRPKKHPNSKAAKIST